MKMMVSIHYMLLVQQGEIISKQESLFVSIHYMLLVQLPDWKVNLYSASFNTLYVVGSISLLICPSILQTFQYIICCWFNLGFFEYP